MKQNTADAPPITVLILDDHEAVVTGLESALKTFGFIVVGGLTKSDEALEAYSRLLPDILVLDCQFVTANAGINVARNLLKKHPNAKIVFYSQFSQAELILSAYRVGGSAFVVKNTPIDTLANAIQQVYEKGRFIEPAIAEKMAEIAIDANQIKKVNLKVDFMESTFAEEMAAVDLDSDESPQSLLLARELLVFEKMALGSTNVEIAEFMDLSPKTISTISQSVKDKLKIHRQAELTLMAVKYRVIQPK